MTDVDQSEVWKEYRRAAGAALAAGEMPAVEVILRRALLQAEATADLNDEILEDIHHLADVFCEHGQYEGAERLCRNALEARQIVLGPRHKQVADSLIRLSIVLRKQGKEAEAAAAEAEAGKIG